VEDVDFERFQIKVQRSIYQNVAGSCKTEASRKPVPMDDSGFGALDLEAGQQVRAAF